MYISYPQREAERERRRESCVFGLSAFSVYRKFFIGIKRVKRISEKFTFSSNVFIQYGAQEIAMPKYGWST